LEDKVFQQQLAEAFEHRLGRIEWVSPRVSFPLVMRHAKQYVLPHLALVGDAAHTIHPLAGQGMNMGLLDAAALVDTIALAKQWQRPIGYLPMLRRYERDRRSANSMMLHVMDAFKHVFSNTNSTLSVARNQGLLWVDNLPWLKNFFMQQAAGNQIDLPSLAKEATWK
jgi:2-octaprenylphenol hydroxylase